MRRMLLLTEFLGGDHLDSSIGFHLGVGLQERYLAESNGSINREREHPDREYFRNVAEGVGELIRRAQVQDAFLHPFVEFTLRCPATLSSHRSWWSDNSSLRGVFRLAILQCCIFDT